MKDLRNYPTDLGLVTFWALDQAQKAPTPQDGFMNLVQTITDWMTSELSAETFLWAKDADIPTLCRMFGVRKLDELYKRKDKTK